MKLLVDMNLSPRWIGFLHDAGIAAEHWSNVGTANAPDSEIMAYAQCRKPHSPIQVLAETQWLREALPATIELP